MSSRGEQARKRAQRGTGSIKKTKYGSYEYRFRYTDVYGNRKTKSFTGRSVDECLDRAEEFQNKLGKLKGGFDLDATIPEILRWKVDNDYAKNYTGEAGYDRNLATIAVIERHAIGRIPIAKLTPVQVEMFLQSMTSYSNTMLKKIHGMLKRAFRIAFDCRLIEMNFMTRDDMRCPKSDKADRKVRGFTEQEQAVFVKALMEHQVPYGRNNYKNQLLIELYSGMRMGEINALKPKNIDFENGFIHVRGTVSRGINYRPYIRKGTKTDAGIRNVPINRLLEPVLRQALSEMKKNPEGLIFYDFRKGDIIETSQVNSLFKRICDKAGIEHTSQHQLRHTFATRCIEAGISPLVLKNWLGHTNIHITLDTYADVFARMNAGAISLLEQHIEEISPVMLPEGDNE